MSTLTVLVPTRAFLQALVCGDLIVLFRSQCSSGKGGGRWRHSAADKLRENQNRSSEGLSSYGSRVKCEKHVSVKLSESAFCKSDCDCDQTRDRVAAVRCREVPKSAANASIEMNAGNQTQTK